MEVKALKASVGYTVGNILIKGCVFFTLPIFSRLLSAEEFGIFNTYMAYESIVAIILGLGLYSSIKNAKFDFRNSINSYISSLLWLTIIPLIVLLLSCPFFINFWISNTHLPFFFIFLLIFQSYGAAMVSVSNAIFSLNYSYGKYVALAGANTITNIFLSIILIMIFRDSGVYCRIIGAAFPLLIIGGYVFLSNQYRGGFTFNKNMACYALSIGGPLIWHYLSQQIQNQFDRIAITNIVGPFYTGIYSFSYNIAIVLQVIFYSVDNVWGIWMFSHMNKCAYKRIRDVSLIYMIVIAFFAVLLMVFSREIIMIMGPREYWEGANIFIPIIIGSFLLFLYTLPAGIEYYYKKTNYIALMTILAAGINVITNYVFIPIFGYIAAAYTTLFSYGVQFLSHWLISKRLLKKKNVNSVYSLKDITVVFSVVCFFGFFTIVLNPYPFVKYFLFFLICLILVLFFYKWLKYAFFLFKDNFADRKNI